jgi:hypothetical protein
MPRLDSVWWPTKEGMPGMNEPVGTPSEHDDDQLNWDELASIIRQSPHPVYNSLAVDAGAVVFLFAVSRFVGAYCEELGKRYAGSTADWASRVRARRKRDDPDKTEIIVPIDSSETVIVLDTDSLNDEAWLALIDLDLMAGDVRGHALRWDAAVGAWVVTTSPVQQS